VRAAFLLATAPTATDRDVTSQPQTAESQAWPVLAQLPRLGAAAPAPESVAEPPRHGMPPAPGGRRILLVDQAHGPRGYDGPASADASHASLTAEREPAPAPQPTASQRRLRIDSRALSQPPARHKPAEPETIAGAMFRLHEALTPYLGLVAAAALIVSGSLLYWSAFGKPQATPTPSTSKGEKSTWASELPSADEASVDADSTVSEVKHDSGTRVADATASQQEVAAEPAPEPPSPATPAAPNVEGPSLTPAAPDVELFNKSASTPPDEPITPTPETGDYPTTPYATFWFDAAAVAQRPTPADSVAPR
jgi:hypothetical protein